MRKLLFIITIAVLATFWGCDKDDSNPVNGAGSVTFRMSDISSGDTVYFQFKASEDIYLDTIIAACAAKQFSDTYIVEEPNRIFQKETLYQWIGYYGVKQGQQWNFTFKGRTSGNNARFSVPCTYMVP